MNEILSHIQSHICASEIIPYPFPHIVVGDFFPADLYQEMIDNFPTPPHSGSVNEQNFLLPEDDHRLSDAEKRLWQQVRDDIYPSILDMVSSKLIMAIQNRVIELACLKFFNSENKKVLEPCDGFQLLERDEGFEIAPHLHGPYEYIDILHYLPSDDSTKAHGTQLYPVIKPSNIMIPPDSYPHVSLDILGEPITIPYLPNTALIYINTSNAIHGKAKFAGQPKRRYIFAYRMFNNDRVRANALPITLSIKS